MPPLKFTEILSFSSEDPNQPADNLLRPDTFRKWRCAAGVSQKQSSVTLKLERLSSIHSIDIGNNGAAFVEVLVAREGGDFQVLLVASSFMTPGESRNNENLNRVRMFGSDKLNKTVAEQKWDRLKLICTQPFNKNMQCGLSFITVTSPEGSTDNAPKVIQLGSFTMKDEEENDSISIGSVFARRKEGESNSPVTGAAAIRAASASAASPSSASPNSNERKSKPFNAPEAGFYQLKKNASPAIDRAKAPLSSKPSSDGPKGRENSSEKSSDRDKDKKRKDADDNYERGRDKQKKNKNSEKVKKPEIDKSKEGVERTKRKLPESEGQTSGSSSTPTKRKSAPFASLLKDIAFVLSGYQNPQRSQIRDMMLEMGARYKSDWDPSCTHLICAFANTPKYQQVKGKGKIVTAKWVFECHKSKIRYPCKRYALGKQKHDDSEEEVWAEELLPKEEKNNPITNPTSDTEESQVGEGSVNNYSDDEDTDDEIERVLAKQKIKEQNLSSDKEKTKVLDVSDSFSEKPPTKKIKIEVKRKQSVNSTNSKISGEVDVKKELNGAEDSIYNDDTDIDEDNKQHVMRPDTSAIPLPTLGDYLKGKFFFIYGNMCTDTKQLLSRYIIAFHGMLEEYMSEKVNFIVTEDEWDQNFDDVLSSNPSLQFVKPSWIWRCCDKQKCVPFQPFMVVPRD